MPISKIPFSQYLSLPHLSASDIVNISRTPRDYLLSKSRKKTKSKEMTMGSLVHCLLLEPKAFEYLFAVEPLECPDGSPVRKEASDGSMRKTKEGKAFLESFLRDNAGLQIITGDDFAAASTICSTICKNQTAKDLLTGTTNEHIAIWEKEEVTCKGQIDAYKKGVLIDIKTTSNIDPAYFEADSYRRRYHQKMAWYKEGLELNGIEINDVYLITASSDECIVRHMSDDLLDRGKIFNERAFSLYKECMKTNTWPSWPETISLGIPGFALYDIGD
jgi:exodeoxyribonuclease VIII